MRTALGRALPDVLQNALAQLAGDEDTPQKGERRTDAVLIIETLEVCWSSNLGMNQNQCLRKALDQLAAEPAAESSSPPTGG